MVMEKQFSEENVWIKSLLEKRYAFELGEIILSIKVDC